MRLLTLLKTIAVIFTPLRLYAFVGVVTNKNFCIETSRVVSAYLIDGFKK